MKHGIYTVGLVLAVFGWSYSAQGLPLTDTEVSGLSWTITNDTLGDAAGGRPYEVFGMGHAIDNGDLYVVVRTNFDVVNGRRSYQAGDLYINLGGTFQDGTGTSFGIATTDHGNNVTNAYTTWGAPVTAGELYSDASGPTDFMFADGTNEDYESNFLGHVGDPNDGDGDQDVNSYPTMIRFGSEVAGDNSAVYVSDNTTDPWNVDLYFRLDLDAIGYAGEDIQLFWTMECGNDGVQHMVNGEIPEPTTVALLASGLVAITRRKKRVA